MTVVEPIPFDTWLNNWAIADEAASEIIQKVQPTSESKEMRKEVIDYIQRLVKDKLGVEVLPFGSVPLKTYLPEGDIDFVTFGGANIEDLAVNMKILLEEEEKNTASKFVVKDVQLIHAEVKLVKCIVHDIVVDISFNQTGGLSCLCFLEQMDRLIGKDHLFKRSIILIKAWSYYESRILGAKYGLISTYALEILVLHLFCLYHLRFDGPLAVLYKFLDYFSKFDWETYCISLNGPVSLSSLPAIVVNIPEDTAVELLLDKDYVNFCIDMFSVPFRGSEYNYGGIPLKHLNIFDPLKENNNLGRSVNKGNYYRVRRAFMYGARKLRQILFRPENCIASEFYNFFSNTMVRHGGGIVQRRPDVVWGFDPCISTIPPCEDYDDEYNNPAPKFSSSPEDVNHNEKTGYVNLLLTEDLTGNFEHFFQCLQYGRWCCNDRELYNLRMLSAQTTPFENNRPCNSRVLLTPSKFKESGDSNQYHNGFQPNTSSTVDATEPGVVTDGGVTCVWEKMPVTFFLPNFLKQSPHDNGSPTNKCEGDMMILDYGSPHDNGSPPNKCGGDMILDDPNLLLLLLLYRNRNCRKEGPPRKHETAANHHVGENLIFGSWSSCETFSCHNYNDNIQKNEYPRKMMMHRENVVCYQID